MPPAGYERGGGRTGDNDPEREERHRLRDECDRRAATERSECAEPPGETGGPHVERQRGDENEPSDEDEERDGPPVDADDVFERARAREDGVLHELEAFVAVALTDQRIERFEKPGSEADLTGQRR